MRAGLGREGRRSGRREAGRERRHRQGGIVNVGKGIKDRTECERQRENEGKKGKR